MSEMLPPPEDALKILKETGCSVDVIKHCEAVANLAVEIAKRCLRNGVMVNINLVYVGALLHDIGRSKTHSVHHAIAGAEIARSLNLPEQLVRIIERHVGGGIVAEEASKLGWSNKDYVPETIEEKIVAYADKLIEGSKIISIEETIERFKNELGKNHPAIERIKRLHDEISRICDSSQFSF